MAERRHKGHPTSPGLAFGPLLALDRPRLGRGEASKGNVAEERTRLDAALEQARFELAALAESADGVGAEVLAFQIELLDDPALVEPVHAAVGAGEAAGLAWDRALRAEIEGYRAAEDSYFAARASDLEDLRERVATALDGTARQKTDLPADAIVLADDLTPSRFLALDRSRLGGIALLGGNPSSHVAILARARGVPMATGLGVVDGAGPAILDAERGLLIVDPDPATGEAYRTRAAEARELALAAEAVRDRPALTADGEPVEVMINVDEPAAVDDATLAASDGVGLFRTEFLFTGRRRLPDEDEQYAAYRALAERLGGRPCIIRTLDVGGDKTLPGVELPVEANPFLGLRGLRLCLERPELFRPQVRALLRVAAEAPVKVMLPMVSIAAELDEAVAVFTDEVQALVRAGVPAAMPPLGIMVETPASALAIDLLDAAFYSIGTNDLTQYVMAAARDSGGRVAALNDAHHPAVLRLIEHVVAHGRERDVPVSLCGDLASDPAAAQPLIGLGLRRFSVAPAALGRVKLAIAGCRAGT